MDTKSKIHQLWGYLNVQDDEFLIVRAFNAILNSDEYIVASKSGNELEITTTNSMPTLTPGTSFQLIQQFGSDGKCKIPSAEQLKKDELIDY